MIHHMAKTAHAAHAVAAKKAVHRIHHFNPAHAHQGATISHCPYPLGSEKAKLWWHDKVAAKVHAASTPAMKAKYGSQTTGMYEGKPLRPGANPGDGDFQFVSDRARVTQGVSVQASKRIAGAVNAKLHGI